MDKYVCIYIYNCVIMHKSFILLYSILLLYPEPCSDLAGPLASWKVKHFENIGHLRVPRTQILIKVYQVRWDLRSYTVDGLAVWLPELKMCPQCLQGLFVVTTNKSTKHQIMQSRIRAALAKRICEYWSFN